MIVYLKHLSMQHRLYLHFGNPNIEFWEIKHFLNSEYSISIEPDGGLTSI